MMTSKFDNKVELPSLTSIATQELHHHDVLSGRGFHAAAHMGNRFFSSLVKSIRNEYVATPKNVKSVFAQFVVKHIRSMDPPGRFLQKVDISANIEQDKADGDIQNGLKQELVKCKDKKTGQDVYYRDIGDKKAVDKTSQALREGAPVVKRMIENGTVLVKKVDKLSTFISDNAEQVYEKVFQGAQNVQIAASDYLRSRSLSCSFSSSMTLSSSKLIEQEYARSLNVELEHDQGYYVENRKRGELLKEHFIDGKKVETDDEINNILAFFLS